MLFYVPPSPIIYYVVICVQTVICTIYSLYETVIQTGIVLGQWRWGREDRGHETQNTGSMVTGIKVTVNPRRASVKPDQSIMQVIILHPPASCHPSLPGIHHPLPRGCCLCRLCVPRTRPCLPRLQHPCITRSCLPRP